MGEKMLWKWLVILLYCERRLGSAGRYGNRQCDLVAGLSLFSFLFPNSLDLASFLCNGNGAKQPRMYVDSRDRREQDCHACTKSRPPRYFLRIQRERWKGCLFSGGSCVQVNFMKSAVQSPLKKAEKEPEKKGKSGAVRTP